MWLDVSDRLMMWWNWTVHLLRKSTSWCDNWAASCSSCRYEGRWWFPLVTATSIWLTSCSCNNKQSISLTMFHTWCNKMSLKKMTTKNRKKTQNHNWTYVYWMAVCLCRTVVEVPPLSVGGAEGKELLPLELWWRLARKVVGPLICIVVEVELASEDKNTISFLL